MSQKLYFLAEDKTGGSDLWVTDGTTTTAVGGLQETGVAGSATGGLGPGYITAFGVQMIFAGGDALNDGESNGIWLTDGMSNGTKEVGGVSPGPNHASPFIGGDPNGLNPTNFLSFGAKALFFGRDVAGNVSDTGLWSTDGTVGGTVELGGTSNGQIVGSAVNWNPTGFAAFNASVIFSANDSLGFNGLWTTDGTTADTVELGGPQNQGIFDSGLSSFDAIDAITLGSLELFNAQNKAGDQALWVTDGTATGTVELGGVGNAGIVGADKNVGFGNGLQHAVRFGARIFFSGPDNGGDDGLWTTDGTAAGTVEVGGLGDAGLTSFGQHPSSLGLTPTDLTVNAQQVLFSGTDALGYKELWASDGTAQGTYEIGGEGTGGFLLNEAGDGVQPEQIVSLGNGNAVFVGFDDNGNPPSGRSSLWVTNGTFAGTFEIGGLGNQGIAGIHSTGFDVLSSNATLVGGDGLAYFIGANAAGNDVLWETNGTVGGTKVVAATDGNAPTTGLSVSNMALANPPASEDAVTGGGQSVNLNNIPGEDVSISGTNNNPVTVTGANGTIALTSAQAIAIGGGLLITLAGLSSATLSKTNGNKDSVFGSKGAITLNGAQANVVGEKNNVTFASGTTGDIVYLSGTKGTWDTVTGSNGIVHLDGAWASVTGGGDVIYFDAGYSGDNASIYSTGGNWDTVYATGGTIEVTQSQVSVVGGGDSITTTSGSTVSLYQTGGAWDVVNATGTAVYLNGASSSIVGGGNSIFATKGSSASLYNTGGNWDAFTGSSCNIILTNAQAAIAGGGNTITLDNKSQVSLSGTAGNWDGVSASGDTLVVTGAQAAITGKGDIVYAYSGSSVSLAGTAGVFDTVYGSTQSVNVNNAQASVVGGANTISATAGSTISVYSTAGQQDAVYGSYDALYLNSAAATLNGSADTVYLSGGSTLTANGQYIGLNFGAKMGVDVVAGFNATDVLTLSLLDWTSFQALQSSGAMTQSNAETIIKLDANDQITLTGVKASTLTASEFKFV